MGVCSRFAGGSLKDRLASLSLEGRAGMLSKNSFCSSPPRPIYF